MATLVTQVTNRLARESSTPSLDKPSIDRAVELSDLYSNVKPQEYILPLTLLSGSLSARIGLNRSDQKGLE